MNKKFIVRGIILIAAVALIVIGVLNGDFRAAKSKASFICYECIGIG